MASRYLTSNELVKTIKRRAFIPENQVTFTKEDLLEMASEEMFMNIIPRILELHEDFYIDEQTVPLTGDRSEYQIPYRAIGNKVRDVSYIDNTGNIFEMTRISIDDLSYYQGSFVNTQYRTFYTTASSVKIYPPVQSNVSGNLKFTYYLSPNDLVTEDRSAKITNIDTVNGIITVESVPSVFSSNETFDLVMRKSPHRILKYDLDASSVSSTNKTITFSSDDIPELLEVGDYVMLSGETIIPQIPTELHSLLAQRVAVSCLEAMNDTEGLKMALGKLEKMENHVGILIDNRVEASPIKVVNRHSNLRHAVYGSNHGTRGSRF